MGDVVQLPLRDDVFTMFVIYASPSDFPRKFVVRQWDIVRANTVAHPEALCVADSIEEARRSLRRGLMNIGRMPGDDPCIAEVWV